MLNWFPYSLYECIYSPQLLNRLKKITNICYVPKVVENNVAYLLVRTFEKNQLLQRQNREIRVLDELHYLCYCIPTNRENTPDLCTKWWDANETVWSLLGSVDLLCRHGDKAGSVAGSSLLWKIQHMVEDTDLTAPSETTRALFSKVCLHMYDTMSIQEFLKI